MMDKITKEQIKKLADSMYLSLTDKEIDELFAEFPSFLHKIELINEVDGVDECKEMIFPFEEQFGTLHEDKEGEILTKKEVLKLAPKTKADQISLPKVVK